MSYYLKYYLNYLDDQSEYDLMKEEFLESVGYPKVHMSWNEWESKAKEFGLDEEQIGELRSDLEENDQLTVPIRFGGKQWWLTEKEIKHVERLQEQFPNDWENRVYEHMDRRTLGRVDTW